jgi:tetratricopeptide (TPR) repeat protein
MSGNGVAPKELETLLHTCLKHPVISCRGPTRSRLGLASLVFALVCSAASAAQHGPALLNEIPSPTHNALHLPLTIAARAALSADLSKRDYPDSERILIGAIQQNLHSPQLLTFLGGVYFLAGSYLECAVAMKKAEVLAPLPDPDRFTLAMAYIVLGHSDWAQPEIERLIRSQPNNALYYYWLSRIDYDRRFYDRGVIAGEKAIALDPNFLRAYDSLGLCNEALGHYQDALRTYAQAARLNLQVVPPSPWPPLELGTLLLRLNRFAEARKAIQKALSIDPRFPEAHYRMGQLLEREGKDAEAEAEFKQAAALRPNYAGPHYALARLYDRLGKTKRAQVEMAEFQRIRNMQRVMGLR